MDGLFLTSRMEAASPVLHPFLYERFNDWLAARGGEVTKTDIRQFPIPLPLYAQANLFGTFDGRTIFLHEDAKAIGGPLYWTLDAMHLGMHCIQMSMPKEMAARLALKFDKEESRAKIHDVEVTPDNLADTVAYEAETHGLILGWVRSLGPELEKRLKRIGMTMGGMQNLLHDFYAADLTYVEYVLSHSELPLMADFFKRLDQNGPERKRFEEIRAMIKPTDIGKVQGTFLEKLPDGDFIFGVRGPKIGNGNGAPPPAPI